MRILAQCPTCRGGDECADCGCACHVDWREVPAVTDGGITRGMLTVGELKKALEGLPDDMPVRVEQECSEGCGTGLENAESCGVEGPELDKVFVVSDAR